MIHDKLEEFVNQQNKLDNESDVLDPKQQLEEWQYYLESLYKEIEDFMSSYTSKGMENYALSSKNGFYRFRKRFIFRYDIKCS